MTEKQVLCRLGTCPPFGELVRTLGEDKHRRMIEEYRDLLVQDPDYLTYHWMSTALKLQYQLKRDDFPDLTIGGCIDELARGCCFVEALREAIVRHNDAPAPARPEAPAAGMG